MARMKSLPRLLCWSVLVCVPLVAASSAFCLAPVIDGLKGKVVFLRGMESGDKLSFDAQGAQIGTDNPGAFAYSAVKVEKVHLSGGELNVQGKRMAMIFQSASESPSLKDIRFVPLKESTDVVIAVDPQHPEGLDAAVTKVFAFNAEEVLSWLSPDDETAALNSLGSTAPLNVPNTPLKGLVSKSALVTHHAGENGLSPPVMIYSVDPATNTNAVKNKLIPGFCLMNLIVDTNGRPEHIRIVHSVDPEQDVSAIMAVAQYRFTPGMYQGKPTPVLINVEVNFRVY